MIHRKLCFCLTQQFLYQTLYFLTPEMHDAEKEKGLLIFLLDGKCTCIWSTMALCKSIYRFTSSCLETIQKKTWLFIEVIIQNSFKVLCWLHLARWCLVHFIMLENHKIFSQVKRFFTYPHFKEFFFIPGYIFN